MRYLPWYLLAAPALAIEPMAVTDMDTVVVSSPVELVIPEGVLNSGTLASGKTSSTARDSPDRNVYLNADSEELNRSPQVVLENIQNYDTDSGFEELLTDALTILGEGSGVDFDLVISGLEYGDQVNSTVNQDGSVSLALPARVDQIFMENLRVQGSNTSMGSAYIQSLELNNSSVVIRTR